MVDVILNRYIFTVFSYQFAILHKTSVSFLRLLQWFFTRFTCFKLHCLLLPFLTPIKKISHTFLTNYKLCPLEFWMVNSHRILKYPILAMLLSEVNIGPDLTPLN
ncbi:mitogen-activated protein kinase kinase kinase 3 [Platysternon megacephalum]|uniref:Mitogen-activated protein kinase kinase kinase 3 n=1 Tax=Platysternon megacephalum TaxID=55544 RepID=A0A4D9EM87_9SAUR|nr:mitogen-activated protein kinase kinase kinase 3 [Platysternon megacephalum]